MSQFDQAPGENKEKEYVVLESLNLTEAEIKSIQAFEELGSGSSVAVLQEGGKKVKADLKEKLQEFREKWGVAESEYVAVVHGKMWQNPTSPETANLGRELWNSKDGDKSLRAIKV